MSEPRPPVAHRSAPGDLRIGLVRLDQVMFHSHNIRRDLRALAASIRRHGVMQPVVVEHYGDVLRLRAGHRRVAAARLAGLTRVPAVIHRDALDEEEWLIASVQENVHRQQIDADERREVVLKLRDLGCTWQGIADAFGVSETMARAWAARPEEAPKKAPARSSKVKASSVRSFAAAWREHATAHPVTVDDVLAALDRMATTGTLGAALPAPDGAAA